MRIAIFLAGIMLCLTGVPDAAAQTCEGKPFDNFRDTCRAKYIEVETRDDGLERVYDNEPGCFRPEDPERWLWYCRGYEEDAGCNADRGETSVRVLLREGLVRWECFEE